MPSTNVMKVIAASLTIFLLLSRSATADDTATAEARADDTTGWYASINGGPIFVSNSDLIFSSRVRRSLLSIHNNADFNPGFNVRGAFGGHVGPCRIEGEIGYRNAHIKSFSYRHWIIDGSPRDTDLINTVNGIYKTTGDMMALSVMINAWRDFYFGRKFLQYVGGGIGFAHVSISDHKDTGISDNVAYQFGVGIGYEISDITTLTVGYRYFDTTTLELKELRGYGITSEAKIESHNIEVGLRFRF